MDAPPKGQTTMTASKHRWFRFSLLTMFVVVTVFGSWLGWQIYLIRNREMFLEAWRQRRKSESALALRYMDDVIVYSTSKTIQSAPSAKPTVPLFRQWLGDRPMADIEVDHQDDAANAVRWFPESRIRLYTRTTPLRPWEKKGWVPPRTIPSAP